MSFTVTPSTPILVTTPSIDTKPLSDHKRDDSSDDQRQQLNKQNKSYTRGNSNKNKQLTRSHAMKESASPPRTPNSHSPSDMKSHSPTAPALVAPDESSSSSQLLTAPTFILPQSEANVGGRSQLDIEFPKLTPPKTKVGWNSSSQTASGARNTNNRKSVSSDTSSNNNSLCEDISESHMNDKTSQKSGSQTISISTSPQQQSDGKKQHSHVSESECEKASMESYNPEERVIISPSRMQCKSPSYSQNHNNNNNDNNNNGGKPAVAPNYQMNVKGKPPLKNMGSSSSCEGGNTSSGFISRDSSSEQFVDQNGIDLVQFFKETLNKNSKDRNMLMKIERELLQLAVDQTGRSFIKFPPMSSYNRMLVHRTAAYFGMDHNVDSTQQCVIASTTKDTRVPEIRFKTLIRDTFSEEPRKSILKRETHSFEDYRQGGLLSVQRSTLNRKAKSFEEREEEYEKEWQWIQHDGGGCGEMSNKLKVPIRLMKIHASSMDGRYMDKNSVSKSHSFGGYAPNNGLMRDDSISSNKSSGPRLHKQDSSASTTWRLSPSSSGYKTQSLRSDSVTPSPTGGYETPEPSAQSPDATRGVVWAVTDLASVPKGSLIIDPQTLQPILNQDGSLYHFDPSNPPATSSRYASNTGNSTRKKAERQKSLNNNSNGKPNTRECTNNNLINNNSASTDSEKSAVFINNNKHSKTNQSTTNDDDLSDVEAPPLEVPKNCESFTDDGSKTKDENCENKSSQCELKSQSTHLNAEELLSPKQKNQSTSPNLPLNETIINEEEESVTPTSSIQPIIEEETSDDTKKDDITSAAETPPVQEIRFQSNPYTNAAAATPSLPPVLSYTTTTPFTAPIETTGTIYHTGPDGTLYVVSSQPVMYSYTTTSTENEVPNCWVPIFDQGAIPSRDPNLTVVPVATPYNGPTLYQSPVVYSTEQFTNPPAIAGQYPVSAYPMGYATYPVNGAPYQNIWPQPMTYFLPPSATPAPTPVLVPPGAPQTPNTTIIQSTTSNTHNPSTNTNATGRRNTPPTNNSNNSSTHAAASGHVTATAVPIQTFPTSVPFSLATSDSTSGTGPAALYAIPPSMYPANVLPYPTATGGFYQPLPHPQANTTIISSVIPNAHAGGTVPSTPHSFHTSGGSGEVVTHFPFNQHPPNNGNNTTSTPQSAPSTPLSLTTMPPNFKNPPLFATPPILTAASTIPAPVHIAHYDDKNKNNNNNNATTNSAPKKYGGNGILNTPPAFSHPSAGAATKTSSNGNNHRHTPVASYQANTNNTNTNNGNNNNVVSAQGEKKSINNSYNASANSHSEDTNSLSNSNMSSNYSSSNRLKNSSNRDQSTASYQPKSTFKSQQHQNTNNNNNGNYGSNSNSNSPNSNDNSESTPNGNGKYMPRGPSRIPPLDLKRNNSSANVMQNHHTRSTPSTNSTESNNSPNSITSYDHSRTYHYTQQQPHHHQQHHHHNQQQPQQHHQYQASGTTTHFYRGNSAGAVNANFHHHHHHHNSNNGSTESASIQTCFPFNVHSQNPGTSTPLLDSCHPQTLIGYNNPMAAGMYVKFGQAFTFANPLPNNRKSPSNDIRTPLAPLAGVYSTMMLPGGPRQINPRTVQNNHNYKGNRTQQR